MTLSIRQALKSDAASVAAIRAAASSAAALSHHGAQELDTARYAELIAQDAGLVYIADINDSIVGYLALQNSAHPAIVGRSPIQLWQLYVIPKFHGAGIAAQLMAAALEHARKHGHDVIWLGVAEHNERGIRFYRKQGFKSHGLHQLVTHGDPHRDVIMSIGLR